MLLTLVLWGLMATVIYAVGIGLVPPGTFSRVGDRIMAALWVGFVVVSNAWLALALFMPLTFWRTLGLTALGVAALWLYRRRRNPEWTWLPKVDVTAVPPLLWLIGVLGLAGLGLLAAQPVGNFDTGLYHYQAVKWLSAYGVTPGIALLQAQLGNASTWYAFIAPFDTEWWCNKLGVTGSFLQAVLWLQVWIALVRAHYNLAQQSDWFLVFIFPLLSLMIIYSPLTTVSPDAPVAVMIIATTWSLLRNEEISYNKAVKDKCDKYKNLVNWLPVTLALGGANIRLSAIPALLITIIWTAKVFRWSINEITSIFFLIILLLAPITIVKFLLSGYPLFPLGIKLYSVDWAYDSKALPFLTLGIRDFARWSWHLPPGIQYSQGWLDMTWLPRWIKIESFMFSYILLGLIIGMFFWRKIKDTENRKQVWLVLITWHGMAYTFIMAPSLRFAVGFLVILPSIALTYFLFYKKLYLAIVTGGVILFFTSVGAFYAQQLSFRSIIVLSIISISYWSLGIFLRKTQILVGFYLVILISLPLLIMLVRFPPKNYFITPFAMPSQPTNIVEINGVRLYRVKPSGRDFALWQYELCWCSPVPCGIEYDPNLTLRDPQRGLAAGFKRLPEVKN